MRYFATILLIGLRDYGTADWQGGRDGCDHAITLGGNGAKSAKQTTSSGTQQYQYRDICGKCGATRKDNQIGLEQTPEAFIGELVAVFREVRRVLKDDGVLWVNIGDSYAAQRGGTHQPAETLAGGRNGKTLAGENVNRDRRDGYNPTRNASAIGMKHKDLIGIPWMLAFALRADGWYLRSEIIWHKPNPMPESVTDRPTKSHEQIFLFAKASSYYFDSEAIKEPSTYPDDNRKARQDPRAYDSQMSDQGQIRAVINPSNAKAYPTRNKRSVWTVPTAPTPFAHFATFPPDLIRPCILAGSKPGDVVLDPFGGSGTTAKVAIELGRKAILCELNPEYVKLIEQRATTTIGFAFD